MQFLDEFCPVDDTKENCDDAGPENINNYVVPVVDDEYLAKLEQELKVLKAMKGYTGPDPSGKWSSKEDTSKNSRTPPEDLKPQFCPVSDFNNIVLHTEEV